MQTLLKWSLLCFALFLAAPAALLAQEPEEVTVDSSGVEMDEEIRTEADEPEAPGEKPLDDVVKKEVMMERRVLPYQPVRESDIMWQRWVWRVLDIREKMNLAFAYPEEPFFKIVSDAAAKGDLPVYSTEDDKFTKRLSTEDVLNMLSKTDTIVTFDPETYEEKVQVVRNQINFEDVKRFRIKETWFFDRETSTMQVRILGIAPLIDVKDNNGNFRYESPMFWVYYPQARELFARHRVFANGENLNATISWEDLFEMRYFASYIYKGSNVHDRRLDEYLTGVDLLLESEKIKNEIFNFEHDLWQY